MKSWNEFSRKLITNVHGFYGCLDKDGLWFDSSDSFIIACHWCCYHAGEFDLHTQEEIEWMNTKGLELGYSIVHSDMLKQMYEKGLIK